MWIFRSYKPLDAIAMDRFVHTLSGEKEEEVETE